MNSGISQPKKQAIYGDESTYNNVCAYALLVVPVDDVEELQKKFIDLKLKYIKHKNAKLHCRILFSGHQRNKSLWENLCQEDVWKIYKELFELIRRYKKIISFCDKSGWPNKIPRDDKWPEIKLGSKELMAHCANSCFIPFQGLFDRMVFYPEPEHTKISWLGKKKKFHNCIRCYIKSSGKIPEPVIESSSLHEIADAMVYVTSHAKTRQAYANKKNFQDLYKILNPYEIFFGRNDKDGGFGAKLLFDPSNFNL